MINCDKIVDDLERFGYSNVPVSQELLEGFILLREVSSDLFTSKQGISNILSPEFISGHRNIGVEYSLDPTRPDLMQAISLPINTLNGYASDNISDFEGLFSLIAQAVFKVAQSISITLNDKYNSNNKFNSCSKDTSFFQVSYYQPVLHERETLQDTHEDGNLFTIVWASAPGLEIIQGEQFIPVNFQESNICVMPGRILSLLTGNKIKTCHHFVKRHQDQSSRISFMCFVNPSLDSPIEPWIYNDFNLGQDIIKEIESHSVEFGLPAIIKVEK